MSETYLYTNCNIATMIASSESDPLGIIYSGAIAVDGDKITFVGGEDELPSDLKSMPRIDMDGAWVTPGLIDCHTHLIFAGDRSKEHALRAQGASYEEIAKAGGGIRSTVSDTRASSELDLFEKAMTTLEDFIAHGVTTMEVKSGYGLSLDDEMKQLRAAKQVHARALMDIIPTCLAAHAVPPEFHGDPDAYIDLVEKEIIPAVAKEGLATAVDAFMENIGFNAEQTSRVFEAAKKHGLEVKLHADQLSDLGGAGLAASHGALSADHLEYTSEASIEAMKASGTIAVMLPGAFITLNETMVPPVSSLRGKGVPIAVASDYNPGSNPNPKFLPNLFYARDAFGMTADEVLHGVTTIAAKALGLNDRGALKAGKKAHIAFWDIEHPHDLTNELDRSPLTRRHYS